MTTAHKSDSLRRLFTAFLAKDRKTAEDLLADDFTFTSQYDDHIDRATYFERCWPNSGHISSQVLEKIFVEGDEAFVLYKCITDDGKDFRNTEFFRFDGDKIRSVDVYFGATYKNGAFVKEATT
jgi:ketosteroid isomerase-like protein